MDACVPETPQELCKAKGATCGQLTGTNKCGNPYDVSCGDCVCGETCTSNTCEVHCKVDPMQQGCACDGECCGGGGICANGVCCIDNGWGTGGGTACGENPRCCSGQANNGQCWGGELNCTP